MAIAELFQHADNPIPATAHCEIVMAKDGVALRVASWKPMGKKASRGTVLVINGRAEFIERWFETIQDLRKRGFHVLSFDWRGQGGSDRLTGNPKKGHVRRFSDYQHDLAAIIAGPLANLPQPHFILAHSMGAALCLEAAAQNRLPVKRMVALAPMLGLSMVKNAKSAAMFAAVCDWLGLGRGFIPGGGATSISTKPFEGNRLTNDPARYARNSALAAEAGHLSVGDPTVRWVHEAFRFMHRMNAPNLPLKIAVPALVIAAGKDPIVDPRTVERFASRLKTGSALVLPTAKHEIPMELDPIREAFWAAFDAFIPGETILPAQDKPTAQKALSAEHGKQLGMKARVA
ncbi:MAG: alpha/beta hydrolase [Bosea sp. (in: a-proteobacteria)]